MVINAARGSGMRGKMVYIYDSTLLLIDDSRELRELVTGILQREGFRHIDTASCVGEAEEYFLHKEPDLLILDINLPDGDGFSLIQKIRTLSDVPVLFLSARDEDSDRLLGLGLGADDYMVKPFLPKELVLRVCAILKRTTRGRSETLPEQEILVLGGCRVDLGSATAFWEGQDRAAVQEESREASREISLTAKEIAILRKLSENRGNIVTFDQLCQAVWQDNYYGYENTIMVHIRRFREKIEETPSKPKYLLTVRGLGYKLIK